MLKFARKASCISFCSGAFPDSSFTRVVLIEPEEHPIPHVTRRLRKPRRWTSRRSMWLREKIMLGAQGDVSLLSLSYADE